MNEIVNRIEENNIYLPGTGGLGEFSLKQRASFWRYPLILSIMIYPV